MNGEKVTFPKLSNTEIVNCLNDLGVQQLTEASLVKPDPEFVHVLYENVVQKLMGLTGEDIAKPVFEAYNALEYPQLYDGAIYEITFMRNLFRVMRTVGVDFKLGDLLTPTYGRTRHFLSGAINFAKYREEKFLKFQELDYEASQLADELLMAEEQNQAVQEELRVLKSEIASEESMAHELYQKKVEVENGLHTLNQLQANMQEERMQLKAKRQEANSMIENFGAQRTRLEQEKVFIQSRILENPERTVKAMEDIRNHLMKERKALEDSEVKRNELVMRLTAIEDSRKAFDKCVSLIVEINQEMNRMKNEKKEIKEHKNMVEHHGNVFRELHVNQQQASRQLIATKEKIVKLQNQQSSCRESYKQTIDAERSKKITAERGHKLVLVKMKELDLEIAKLESEEKTMTRIHMAETGALETGISNMLVQVRQYHTDLFGAIQKTEERQEKLLLQQQQRDKMDSPIVLD